MLFHFPGTIESVKDIDRVLAEHGHIFTKVKFSFTIEKVSVALLTKSSVSLITVGTIHDILYSVWDIFASSKVKVITLVENLCFRNSHLYPVIQ